MSPDRLRFLVSTFSSLALVHCIGAAPGFAITNDGIWSRVAPPGPIPRSTAVSFELDRRGPARFEVVDVAGRVRLAQDLGTLAAGRHSVRLESVATLPSGVYVVRLSQGARVKSTKMVRVGH